VFSFPARLVLAFCDLFRVNPLPKAVGWSVNGDYYEGSVPPILPPFWLFPDDVVRSEYAVLADLPPLVVELA